MNIGVDIDGTLSKSYEAITELLRSLGHDVEFEMFDYFKGFSPVLTADEMWDIYDDHYKDLRKEYEVYEGARAILHLLEKHNIFLITARNMHRKHYEPFCESTVYWLEKNDIPHKQLIFARHKMPHIKEQGIDVMIEDAPHEVQQLVEHGIPVLLHDQPYNRSVKHDLVIRFTHWLEVPRLIERAAALRSRAAPRRRSD